MADSEEVDWETAKEQADEGWDFEKDEPLMAVPGGEFGAGSTPSATTIPGVNPPQPPTPPSIPVAPSAPVAPSDPQVDQASPSSETQEAPEDQIDIIAPKKEPKEWKIGAVEIDGTGAEMIYVQRGLSYFGKMQWFSLVGEVIDKALTGKEGEQGLELSSIFSGGLGGLNSLGDLDTFLQAAAKLLVYAPDFLEKSYCIWLGIPDHEREWARVAMAQVPERGGLTDDQGIEIIEIFIDQNWEAIETFFREKLPRVLDRGRSRMAEAAESRQSKP